MSNEDLVRLDDYRGYEVYFNKSNKGFTIQRGDEVIAKSSSWPAVVRQVRKTNYDPKLLKKIPVRKVLIKNWNGYVEAELTGKVNVPDSKYTYSYDHLQLEVIIPGNKPQFELPANIFLSNKEEAEIVTKLKAQFYVADGALRKAEASINKNCIALFIKNGKLPV